MNKKSLLYFLVEIPPCGNCVSGGFTEKIAFTGQITKKLSAYLPTKAGKHKKNFAYVKAE